jgi:hypothetical protein
MSKLVGLLLGDPRGSAAPCNETLASDFSSPMGAELIDD